MVNQSLQGTDTTFVCSDVSKLIVLSSVMISLTVTSCSSRTVYVINSMAFWIKGFVRFSYR